MNVNRRQFVGGLIASAAAPGHAERGESPKVGRSPAEPAPPRKWTSTGVIDAGGSHEPYLFVVRRGGQRLDAKQECAEQQSESLLRSLHDSGVNVFHTHFYKGFGMEAEREGMEQTRRAIRIAHSLGMKVDTYIQWNSLMYETFFAEEPRAVNWIQRDIAGLPILLPYGYQQSFRYRPCFSNQEYLEYLKKVVRAAVQAGTDFIHFDNFDLNAEPDSCHCTSCTTGFREFLKRKYSASEREERFGFARVDFINPPQWNRENPPEKMQVIYDPVLQEWMDFRCQTMADALEQMYKLVQSLNRDVALEINPNGITGENRPWQAGIDHSRLLKFTSAFWSEEENVPGCLPDGRLISKIRSYKLARAYENVLFTYIENQPLAMAEALAFNQTLGFVGSNPLSATTKQYMDFYLRHRPLYDDTVDKSAVAVFRSYESLAYNNAEVQLCTVLAEQALLEAGVPFDYLFNDGLHDLNRFKVVVLPDTECLSDTQVEQLKSFVRKGGGLVILGQSGMYEHWRRVRIRPAFAEWVPQASAAGYQERVEARMASTVLTSQREVEGGRVAYLSALPFDGPLPASTPYFAITSEFWKRPKNAADLVSMARWAAGGSLGMSISGPLGLVANCTDQPSLGRLQLHLLNYDASSKPLSGIEVKLEPPEGKAFTALALVTPESKEPVELAFETDANGIRFRVEQLLVYAVVTARYR